jgi:hypothetical protein
MDIGDSGNNQLESSFVAFQQEFKMHRELAMIRG